MELTYEKNGDYLIPNLTPVNEPEGTLTKYGLMHRNYLKEHRRGIYSGLLMEGRLKAHCLERQKQAEERMDLLTEQMAEKEGVTYAIQCKCYTSPVGVKAVQEAYAGRDYYDRMVGAVMTNQYFTAPAVDAAKKLKILLWDGGYVERMMEEV